jgi:hypothetical protein
MLGCCSCKYESSVHGIGVIIIVTLSSEG